jgi:hypothetical protein
MLSPRSWEVLIMRTRAVILVVAAVSLGLSLAAPAGATRSTGAEGLSTTPVLPDVKAFGDAEFFGATNSGTFNQPIVGVAGTNSTRGYWEVARDGGVFAFGDATFLGSMGGTHLNQPVVGIAATPPGNGYWLVASDGGVFGFGDATFLGSMGGTHLNQPVVGIATTPTGNGYWLVASDGGVFSFGDAKYRGSMGGTLLSQPVVGIASAPGGVGYWLVASDGGVFSFGDAKFLGSLGAPRLDDSIAIAGMAAQPAGDGYWMADADGRVFRFGLAPGLGDALGSNLSMPVVAIASTPTGGGFWLAGRGASIAAPEQVTEPGCAANGSQRTVRPTSFLLTCADGNSRIDNATWSVWGADHASGTATLTQNDCEPYCAVGHFHSQTADLTLDQPVLFHGHRVFSRLVAQLHGPLAPFTTTTVTFTLV